MGNTKSKVHSEALRQLYSMHNSDASLVVTTALFAWPFRGEREAILSQGGQFCISGRSARRSWNLAESLARKAVKRLESIDPDGAWMSAFSAWQQRRLDDEVRQPMVLHELSRVTDTMAKIARTHVRLARELESAGKTDQSDQLLSLISEFCTRLDSEIEDACKCISADLELLPGLDSALS